MIRLYKRRINKIYSIRRGQKYFIIIQWRTGKYRFLLGTKAFLSEWYSKWQANATDQCQNPQLYIQKSVRSRSWHSPKNTGLRIIFTAQQESSNKQNVLAAYHNLKHLTSETTYDCSNKDAHLFIDWSKCTNLSKIAVKEFMTGKVIQV